MVCSDALLSAMPPEVEQYTAAMLWKSLRGICTRIVAEEELDGHRVRVYTIPVADAIRAADAGAD